MPPNLMQMERDLVHLIERLVRFPYPLICRHLVASDLLALLERHGVSVSMDLAQAVVGADDERALELLAERKMQFDNEDTNPTPATEEDAGLAEAAPLHWLKQCSICYVWYNGTASDDVCLECLELLGQRDK